MTDDGLLELARTVTVEAASFMRTHRPGASACCRPRAQTPMW
ncbi:MAG: hypothetical protein ACR2KL_04645 [Nocardioidaceae bacterium]